MELGPHNLYSCGIIWSFFGLCELEDFGDNIEIVISPVCDPTLVP